MKKFLKVFALIILVFLVFLYFLGSCTSIPKEHKNNDNSVEFHEVTPEEYEKEMQNLVGSQFLGLTAHAESVVDSAEQLWRNVWELTPAYNIYDYLAKKKELDTINNSHGGGGHYRYPVADDKSTVVINYEYDFYGKNRVVYSSGAWEIIECRLLTSDARSDGTKTGVVKYTRTNQNYSTTSFSFDISTVSVTQVFNSTTGFYVKFKGLESYTQGCTQAFLDKYLTTEHIAEFVGSATNDVKQINYNSTKSYGQEVICWGARGSYPNIFSLCSTVSNDYEFSQTLDNYYSNNSLWRLPNLYYNNNAGDTINQTNVNNYKQYGYTYNTETNSIEFDSEVFLSYFDTTLKPLIQTEFNSVFSKFPDINAKFGDLEIEYTNLVDIINNINNSTTTTVTGTYPIVTTGGGGCDCDIYVTVTVDVSVPEEFYRTYPALTTEPAFIADSPDIDYALDEPLPFEILGSAGQFLTTFSDILTDNGLMPLYMMCIALSLVAFFLL